MCTLSFFGLKESGLRYRRHTEIADSDTEESANTHPIHMHWWAILVSSAITVILLVLVSLLCVSANKNSRPPSPVKLIASSIPQNIAAQEVNGN